MLFNPYLSLGRNTLYTSTIVNGQIDTALKFQRINAAMAEAGVQTVVFDRGYDITMERATTVSGSAQLLFDVPLNVTRIIGDPSRPLDMSFMETVISGTTQRYLFTVNGSQNETAASLTVDATLGDETIIVGSSGMAILALEVGDKVRITSNKEFIAGGTASTEDQGEIATVVSITSDRFTILPVLQDSYAVSDSARVLALYPHKGLRMEGITAIGPGMLRDGSDPVADAVTGDRFLDTYYADRLRLDTVNVTDFDNGAFWLYASDDYEIRSCRVQFQTTSAYDRSLVPVNQYGIALVNCCQDGVVESNTVVGGKHCVVQTESSIGRGVTRRLTIRGNTLMGSHNFAIATHTNAEQIEAEGNEILGCRGGIEAGCRNFTSRNNKIRGLLFREESSPGAGDAISGIGINVAEVAENIISDGDQVYGGGWSFRCDTSDFPLLSGSVGPTNIAVRNLYSQDANQDAVQILWNGTGARSDFDITNLQARNVGRPVDADGYPTSGTPTAANSFDIRGNASGRLARVQVNGGNLRGWDTSADVAGYVAHADGVHLSNISYGGRNAPSIAGTCTGGVTSNVNVWA